MASRPAAKLNVLNKNLRIETSDVPDGFFLVLGDANAAYFVRQAQEIYMNAKQSSLLTQVLVAVDPNDPFRQWRAAARIAGAPEQSTEWRCERSGDDSWRIVSRFCVGASARSSWTQGRELFQPS